MTSQDLDELSEMIKVGEWEQFETITTPLKHAKWLVEQALKSA